jgi:hypothetical protein
MSRAEQLPNGTLTRQGDGAIAQSADGFLLLRPAAGGERYHNAQIDDTTGLRRGRFLRRPPLRLTLRARFSHGAAKLRGTAGFGFWNDPFAMSGSPGLALPQTAWFFFASPPSNMALARDVPGWGFKAATVDAHRPALQALLPLALPAAPLLGGALLALRVPALHRRLWPLAERAAGIAEAPLPVNMRAWHSYTIDWQRDSLSFAVDGHTVLQTRHAPAGPMGLVIWIDNQFMVATPQGAFAHGLVACHTPQWLEVAEPAVESGGGA